MAHIIDVRPACTDSPTRRVFDVFAVADADWPTFDMQKDAPFQFQATQDNGLLDAQGTVIMAKIDALIAEAQAPEPTEYEVTTEDGSVV